jgi:hypothetical protein
MTQPTDPRPRTVRLSDTELQAMLSQAAEQGAKSALEKLGLHDDNAPRDLRDLRDLLSAWRATRQEVGRTVLRVATTAILGAIITAVWLYAGAAKGVGQ